MMATVFWDRKGVLKDGIHITMSQVYWKIQKKNNGAWVHS
jgi:hypothetical protein